MKLLRSAARRNTGKVEIFFDSRSDFLVSVDKESSCVTAQFTVNNQYEPNGGSSLYDYVLQLSSEELRSIVENLDSKKLLVERDGKISLA